MGGYIALEVMHQARDRVLGLIMIDSSARPDTPEQSEQRRKRIASAQAGDFKSVVDDQFPQLVHPDNSRNETLAALNMAMAEDCGAGAFIRHQEAIIQRPDSRPDLAAITCPTLILVGDSDRVTPPELSQEMADGITDARLEIIPGAGHLSLLEQPDAVNRALISWLDTALPDGQS
jgi:pimeloyl-ACP methyl ester carboxylesterase